MWEPYRVSLCRSGITEGTPAHPAGSPYSRWQVPLRKCSCCLITHFIIKIRQEISFGMTNLHVVFAHVCVCMCLEYDSSNPCSSTIIRGEIVSFTHLKSCPVQEIWWHWILYLTTGGLVSLHSHQSTKLFHEMQKSRWRHFIEDRKQRKTNKYIK